MVYEIRLFGGFDVRLSGEPVRGLESRKVKALFAYLLLNRERGELTRGHLATLLWPDEGEDAGRQNLRQAIYNLRKTLRDDGSDTTGLAVTNRECVSLSKAYAIWLDVDELESAVRKSLVAGECVDPRRLGEATRLYRGPLLSGLFIDECHEFEEWLLARQEHLRDSVLDALRSLVSHYLRRGDLDQGLLFARRWADLDPVSEEAHRALMVLYARSGRRAQALAQYERCRQILSLEFGVTVIEETRELHRRIQSGDVSAAAVLEAPLPVGPFLPLVGRDGEITRLRSIWSRVLAGDGRLTVLTGPAGIGKSRLAKTFIHEAAALSGTSVLLGRCRAYRLPRCYEPIADSLRNAAEQDGPAGQILRAGLENGVLADLALGSLAQREPGLSGSRTRETDPGRLADIFARYLERVHRANTGAGPSGIVVFLEDLCFIDGASVQFLDALVPKLAGTRTWILATCRADQLPDAHPLRALFRRRERSEGLDVLELGPLEAGTIEELVKSLAEEDGVPRLTRLLEHRWSGVPLHAAEWMNLLRDEGLLVPAEGGRWSVRPGLDDWARSAPSSLEELTLRRLSKLPASARRLLTLAAVMGDDFDTEILESAADELPVVLEAAMGLLVERRFARQSPRIWFENRRELDVVLWREGTRRGTFEFANKALRRFLYDSVPRARRKAMHADVAHALERRFAGEALIASEELSHHLLLAEKGGAALPYLRASEERARLLGAPDAAEAYNAVAEKVSGSFDAVPAA